MPHGCRAAPAVLRRPRVRPLPAQPPIATAYIAWAMCRSAVNIGHGFPHGEETEVQYIIGENIRGEEQENLTFMSPGRGNR